MAKKTEGKLGNLKNVIILAITLCPIVALAFSMAQTIATDASNRMIYKINIYNKISLSYSAANFATRFE